MIVLNAKDIGTLVSLFSAVHACIHNKCSKDSAVIVASPVPGHGEAHYVICYVVGISCGRKKL